MKNQKAKELQISGEAGLFCDVWHVARNAINLISTVTNNPLVKGACQVVIMIGNQFYKKLCPKE